MNGSTLDSVVLGMWRGRTELGNNATPSARALGAWPRYGTEVRPLWIAVLVALVSACTTGATRPSTVAERTPTPESVTTDNPGGDAESPTDAALMRLLTEPLGHKTDKFKTLRAHFADVDNWKRVKFFGHPTRAGFRYGKKPPYGFGVIEYRPAEDSDAPHACLEQFVRRATRLTKKFDIEIDPVERSLRKHYRGSESIDWIEHDRKAQKHRQAAEARRAEQDALRQRRLEARRQAQARAKMRQRIRGVSRPSRPRTSASPAGRPRHVVQLERILKRSIRRAHLAAHRATVAGRDLPAEVEVFVRGGEGRKTLVVVSPPLAELEPRRRAPPPKKPPAHKPPPRELTPEERFERGWQAREKRFGMTAMPVAQTAGRFQTLFDRDEYVGALVAYDSWPGTCLVQGFTVKVGTDPNLAQRVVERWIDEMAPRLMWDDELRKAPEHQNR